VVLEKDKKLMRGGSLREEANQSSCARKLRSAAPDGFLSDPGQEASSPDVKHMGGDTSSVGTGGENSLESVKPERGSALRPGQYRTQANGLT
jgi:hypothetical protein